ncbi:hepatoma-derived growth factor-related protein 2-like [Hypanus sabinus]|uniref:hepatoma-derived growth factor-related protein 2-like n=1 Tax=Hypanus sabinus TaxID=79690 RepID=UPI0028C37FA8|nr:hepatoma-derived growth factor-related protein 2-like [Hypanus sabinus]
MEAQGRAMAGGQGSDAVNVADLPPQKRFDESGDESDPKPGPSGVKMPGTGPSPPPRARLRSGDRPPLSPRLKRISFKAKLQLHRQHRIDTDNSDEEPPQFKTIRRRKRKAPTEAGQNGKKGRKGKKVRLTDTTEHQPGTKVPLPEEEREMQGEGPPSEGGQEREGCSPGEGERGHSKESETPPREGEDDRENHQRRGRAEAKTRHRERVRERRKAEV